MFRFPSLFLTMFAVLGLSPECVFAQDVQWRQNYEAALKEAKEKNRPLFVNCECDGCVWCRRLDQTFLDAKIAATLNAQFVPLRLNASNHPEIVKALGVRAFPTLIYARPDSVIVMTREGFVEPGALQAQFKQILLQ